MTSRRDFLQKLLILPGMFSLVQFINSCTSRQFEKKIRGNIIGASASKGHLLRDKSIGNPEVIIKKDTVIVGGGISGLSAARHLLKNNHTEFIILELEKESGGNSSS